MELDSDRRFRFPVAPDAFWAAVSATDRYRDWWPWLRAFEAAGLVDDDVWRCAVRSPLPYTVRFTVHLRRVEAPTLIEADIQGDITGTARLRVTPHDAGCDVQLTSTLAPAREALRMVASVARPLVHRGHDWVLDTGARQFATRAITT